MTTVTFGVIRLNGDLVAGAFAPDYPDYVGPLDASFFEALDNDQVWNGIDPAGVPAFTVTALDSAAEAQAIALYAMARDDQSAFAWDTQDGVTLLTQVDWDAMIQDPESWELLDMRRSEASLGGDLVAEGGKVFEAASVREGALEAYRSGSLKPKAAAEGVLADWRHDQAEHEPPLSHVGFKVMTRKNVVSVHMGGSEDDPYGPQACTIAVERVGPQTRILINDSLCDEPMILAIPDGQSIEQVRSGWSPQGPSMDPGL